jgi:hypothetical protein
MPRRDITKLAKTREAFNNLISGKRNPDTSLQSAPKRSKSSLSNWRNSPINLDGNYFYIIFFFIRVINILIFLINDLDDDDVEDSEASNVQMLKKIIRQNSEMNVKLDSMLARQKAIEDRFARMEVGYNDKHAEKGFTKVIIFKLYYYLLYCYFIINFLIYLDYR